MADEKINYSRNGQKTKRSNGKTPSGLASERSQKLAASPPPPPKKEK